MSEARKQIFDELRKKLEGADIVESVDTDAPPSKKLSDQDHDFILKYSKFTGMVVTCPTIRQHQKLFPEMHK